ncbi:hypothetical protein [Allofranklinella schreckenbergeri]|uniref:hypothetical protein n=1 Tax=Allofranklinella schreckenbergeri TaxID=1076744 RepID=UPI001EEF513A|nr:hypothetical protein [Allofranklinella schreckenbergeri]
MAATSLKIIIAATAIEPVVASAAIDAINQPMSQQILIILAAAKNHLPQRVHARLHFLTAGDIEEIRTSFIQVNAIE